MAANKGPDLKTATDLGIAIALIEGRCEESRAQLEYGMDRFSALGEPLSHRRQDMMTTRIDLTIEGRVDQFTPTMAQPILLSRAMTMCHYPREEDREKAAHEAIKTIIQAMFPKDWKERLERHGLMLVAQAGEELK